MCLLCMRSQKKSPHVCILHALNSPALRAAAEKLSSLRQNAHALVDSACGNTMRLVRLTGNATNAGRRSRSARAELHQIFDLIG